MKALSTSLCNVIEITHDDVIKGKHFPRCWLFGRGINRSPANSPHKGLWRGALIFFFICAWINGWVNNGGAGDLRRRRAYYDVTVMLFALFSSLCAISWALYCAVVVIIVCFIYVYAVFYEHLCSIYLPLFYISADRIAMELSLRISGHYIVSRNFTFFDCDLYDSWVHLSR